MLPGIVWKPILFTWPIQTWFRLPKITHSKMHQKFYYFKPLHQCSRLVVGSLWSIQIQTWTENSALFNSMKNKITKTFKSSYEIKCFLVVFECLFQSIGQSKPDPDSRTNLFKDTPEVLLLQNENFTLFNWVKNKITKTCKSSYCSNASWSCLKAYSFHLANLDLIKTPKITH